VTHEFRLHMPLKLYRDPLRFAGVIRKKLISNNYMFRLTEYLSVLSVF